MAEFERWLQVRLTPEQEMKIERLREWGYNISQVVRDYLMRLYEKEANERGERH